MVKVKMLDAVPAARVALLRAVLADMEALASDIRAVSPCQSAAQAAIASMRVCGMTWTGEAESWWSPVSPIPDEDNARRAMRSQAGHLDRLREINRRLLDLGSYLHGGTPHGMAHDAATHALRACAAEWTGLFALHPASFGSAGR